MNSTHIDFNHTNNSGNVFDNPEMFVGKFDSKDREEWQKPKEVINLLNLKPDGTVIELGAGTGYFTIRLAEHVACGEIHAYEQAPKMAEYLKNRVSTLGLNNVRAYTTESGGNIPSKNKADLIFSVDVYHHIHDRVACLSKLLTHLKPEGTIVVIDRTDQTVSGQPAGHRVAAVTVKEEMQKAGFELSREHNLLLPIQYFLEFKRKV